MASGHSICLDASDGTNSTSAKISALLRCFFLISARASGAGIDSQIVTNGTAPGTVDATLNVVAVASCCVDELLVRHALGIGEDPDVGYCEGSHDRGDEKGKGLHGCWRMVRGMLGNRSGTRVYLLGYGKACSSWSGEM